MRQDNTRNTEAVIVIGAGASGLAAARELKLRGIPVRILDRARRAGEAWYHRHPQLRLNTHRKLSALPGMEMPKSAGAFPSRISVIHYLRDYAAALEVPIDYGVEVKRLDPSDGGFSVETSAGTYRAHHVVVATGFDRLPYTPAWKGRESFATRLVHAADFGNLAQYRGKNILVVGAGNSGSDILNHLVTIPTGRLWVSVRHGPVVFPQRLWGFPVQRLSPLMALLPVRVVDRMLALTELVAFGRLEKWGWRRHPSGGATRLVDSGISPAIDRGFVAALKAGRLSLLPEIERFEPATVCLADGQRIEPDVVIAATGYRSGLESMLGHLAILNDRGVAEIHGSQQDARYPGLWFTGMQPRLTGFFHLAGQTARAIAAAIAEDYRGRETGLIAAGTELGEIRP